MTGADIARMRMHNQMLSVHPLTKPEAVVSALGPMQSQDYPGGLWAVAQRTPGATRASVEDAIARHRIIRTWPMRGTLHFIAGTDARWILDLLTPRFNDSGGWATRRAFLGLTDDDLKKARRLVIRALQGGNAITRADFYAVLERGGIATKNQRGAHLLGKLAHEQIVCLGPYQGKQSTVVLLEEWIPRVETLERDEGLARLTLRYFTAHGPATVYDMSWWAGLTLTDVRRGVELVGAKLAKFELDGATYFTADDTPRPASSEAYLLPPFDELLVGYKDRSASMQDAHKKRVITINGIFSPIVVIDGQVEGIWKRTTGTTATTVTLTPLRGGFSPAARRAIGVAADRYATYLGTPVILK